MAEDDPPATPLPPSAEAPGDIPARLAGIERELGALEHVLAEDRPRVARGGWSDAETSGEAEGSAERRAAAIVARAEAHAERILAEAQRRAASLRREMEELLALRRRVIGSARRLVEDWEQALARVESQRDPQPPTPAVAPLPLPGDRLVVEAGPFADVPALRDFQQALQGLPGARSVRVRSFDGRRATFVLRLDGPLALEADLPAALGSPVALAAPEAGRVLVALRRQPLT